MIRTLLLLAVVTLYLYAGDDVTAQPAEEQAAPDFSRLVFPDVATALELTEEQNAEVVELLQQRTQALLGAEDGKAVISSFEQKLASVLNDQQRQQFARLAADKTIFFNFREQKWPDVLVWFAKQADLALVASDTPDGAFTYSSATKYSPAEAIDLLNRVLQAKGHTLIRKGQLLFCVDLSNGLPVGLIPRVTEEELTALGELEFATIIVPLGRREVSSVSEEVKPLLGDFGRSLPLAQTQQLMLTGTVGDLRAATTLIKAIPEPAVPAAEPPRSKPPGPELRIHKVEGVAIETAVATLNELLSGDAKLTFDRDSQQINAFCVPSQHQAIELMLAKMKENHEPGKGPYVESYAYENADPETLAEQLRFAVPDIAVNIDAAGERLLVFATPTKQTAVRNTLRRLDVALEKGDERVAVYDVSRGDSAKLVEILTAMVPEAEVSANTERGKIIVRATREDHQIVEQLIEKMDPTAGLPDERQLDSYEIDDQNRAVAEQLIRELYPDLKVVVDNSADQLLIWATSQQHDQIKAAIAKLPKPDDRELVFHQLKDRRIAREIKDNISNLIKDINVREHDGGRQLAVIATSEQQQQVRELIAKLEAAKRPEPNRTLAFYPLPPSRQGRFDAMRSLLGEELDGMKTFENSPEEIGVWATVGQHALVKQMLNSVEGAVDATKRQLKSYAVQKGEPAAIAELLTELYQDARIVPDETAGRVMVWARAAEQIEIAEAVRQLDSPASERNKQTLQVYPVGETDPTDIAPVLQRVAPDATVSGDRATKSMIVWATKKDHEKIIEAIRQFRENDPNERIMAVYPAGGRDYYSMRNFLREMADDASLTFDSSSNQFGVLATAEEHASIKKALELFAASDIEGAETTIVSYPVNMDADAAIEVLRQIVPKANLIDADGDTKVIAIATADDHKKLKSTIEQMSSGVGDEGWEFRVYQSNRATASAVNEVFRQMSPSAVVVPDGNTETISIWAPTADHGKFAKVLASVKATRIHEQQIVLYKLSPGIEASQATEVINQVAPPASVVSSSEGQVVVIGVEEDHGRIKQSIDALNAVAVDIPKTDIAIYKVVDVNPASIVAAVQPQLAEGETIDVDPDGKAVLVRAPTPRQTDIRRLVDRVMKELPQVAKTVARVYSCKHVDPSVAQTALTALLPAATIAVDQAGRNLLATATAADHEKIKQAIDQLDVQRQGDVDSRVYRVEHISGSTIQSVLQRLAPTATIVPSDVNNVMIVTAGTEDHGRIEALIKDIDQPGKNKPVLVAYPVTELEPQALQSSLQTILSSPTFSVTADPDNGAILARATLEEHQVVSQVIQQLSSGKKQPVDMTLKVHSLGQMEIADAIPSFQSLFENDRHQPRFTYTNHQSGGQLLAVATTEQHQVIEAAVQQLLEQASSGEPILLVYAVPGLDAAAVENSLQELLSDDDVRASADVENGAILVKATLEDHRTVSEVIEKLKEGTNADSQTTLQVYALGFADSDAALPALQALFADQQPVPSFSMDFLGTQLMAVATATQHLAIAEAVKQIQGEPQLIQGYRLERVDPLTAQNAINNLFISAAEPPSVNVDDRSQKVFVRGYREQIDAVKDLLVGMGETNLDGAQQSQGTFKVIPVRGDSQAMLEQIQQVWPQLRSNPLEVIAPEEINRGDAQAEEGAGVPLRTNTKKVALQVRQGATNRARPADQEASAIDEAESDVDTSDDSVAKQTDAANRAPIVAVPSEGKITVMSDDPQAIRQFEQLLNLLPKHSGTRVAGNFSVVLMREASAVNVARTLEKLISSMPEPQLSGFSGVQIVADERMNAVIVHGRLHERENVEELLRILDTSNVPNSLASDVPTIVPVQNTDAARIVKILKAVYRTQLETGGRAKDISIPDTVDVEVAAVLKQINAASAAPLLTLEVDEITNSIVILAPQTLTNEVTKLIRDLDQRAVASAARGVSIIQLKQMNTEAVQEALDRLLERKP